MSKYVWKAFQPLIVMLVILFAIITTSQGLPLNAQSVMLDFIDSPLAFAPLTDKTKIAVIYDKSNDVSKACVKPVTDALDEMRIPWMAVDSNNEIVAVLSKSDTILICTPDLTSICNNARDIIRWLEDGGHMAIMTMPYMNNAFNAFSHIIGIMDYPNSLAEIHNFKHLTALLPMWNDQMTYSSDMTMQDFILPVRLEEDCTVHIAADDEAEIPLLWTREVGKGRIVVNNNSLIQEKAGRGMVVNTLFAIQDVLVYPIINTGVIFIDDFPAPQPEGKNELIKQYGYDTKSFFRNRWWPDMKQLAVKKGIRYTGLLIETYNDNVTGPFVSDCGQDAMLRYYAAELLSAGGELGLHGYNHQPLCLNDFQFVDENYLTWPSAEKIAENLQELYRYARQFSSSIHTYVAPSNYLSNSGLAVLRETLPDIRIIAGVYLPLKGYDPLIQEFQETMDGSIEFPRISSGLDPSEFDRYMIAQEMVLHGVFSHFFHPDDVLDVERGAKKGWNQLYQSFSGMVNALQSTYPCLRWSTSYEGAAAIQRYDRLTVKRTLTETGMTVNLAPFYDEAWLALKTDKPVEYVDGGELYPITSNFFWIRANKDELRIRWKDTK